MIRPAVEGDIPAVIFLNDQVQPLPWSHEGLRSEFQNPDFLGLIHEKEFKMNGYLLAREHCDGADLMMLGVAQDSRRQGVGQALVEGLKGALRQERKNELSELGIFLEVSQRNHQAIALYEKMGFKTYLVRKSYYGDGSDALCMKLVLAKAQ